MTHIRTFSIKNLSPIASQDFETGQHPQNYPLLSPSRAWQILHRRTGKQVARSTFYRWIESGKLGSVRVGARVYVPWPEIDQAVRRCMDGEPL